MERGSQTKYGVAIGDGERPFLLNNSAFLRGHLIYLKFFIYFLLPPTVWIEGTVRLSGDGISKIYLYKCHLEENPVFPVARNQPPASMTIWSIITFQN